MLMSKMRDQGHYHTLMVELQHQEQPYYRNVRRMPADLLAELGQRLTTVYTEINDLVLRVAITLRHLATG